MPTGHQGVWSIPDKARPLLRQAGDVSGPVQEGPAHYTWLKLDLSFPSLSAWTRLSSLWFSLADVCFSSRVLPSSTILNDNGHPFLSTQLLWVRHAHQVIQSSHGPGEVGVMVITLPTSRIRKPTLTACKESPQGPRASKSRRGGSRPPACLQRPHPSSPSSARALRILESSIPAFNPAGGHSRLNPALVFRLPPQV